MNTLLCFGYFLALGKNSPFLQITANNQIPVLVTRKKSRLTMTCANPIMQMGFALNIEIAQLWIPSPEWE